MNQQHVVDFYSDEGWEASMTDGPIETPEQSAICLWYEHFDNTYDGWPLKDFEVEMLRVLGKGIIA